MDEIIADFLKYKRSIAEKAQSASIDEIGEYSKALDISCRLMGQASKHGHDIEGNPFSSCEMGAIKDCMNRLKYELDSIKEEEEAI